MTWRTQPLVAAEPAWPPPPVKAWQAGVPHPPATHYTLDPGLSLKPAGWSQGFPGCELAELAELCTCAFHTSYCQAPSPPPFRPAPPPSPRHTHNHQHPAQHHHHQSHPSTHPSPRSRGCPQALAPHRTAPSPAQCTAVGHLATRHQGRGREGERCPPAGGGVSGVAGQFGALVTGTIHRASQGSGDYTAPKALRWLWLPEVAKGVAAQVARGLRCQLPQGGHGRQHTAWQALSMNPARLRWCVDWGSGGPVGASRLAGRRPRGNPSIQLLGRGSCRVACRQTLWIALRWYPSKLPCAFQQLRAAALQAKEHPCCRCRPPAVSRASASAWC